MEDESLDEGEKLKMEKLHDCFKAGWKEWKKKNAVDREDRAYQAFKYD